MTALRFMPRAAAWLLAAAWSACAHAATFPVDDSASVVQQSQKPVTWRSLGPGGQSEHRADALTRVQLVLNTQPWKGRTARIHMLLPPQAVRTQVQWQTRGVLLPGSMQSGERALVYDGVVPEALRDLLDVRITVDGRELSLPQRLNFSYEIDLP